MITNLYLHRYFVVPGVLTVNILLQCAKMEIYVYLIQGNTRNLWWLVQVLKDHEGPGWCGCWMDSISLYQGFLSKIQQTFNIHWDFITDWSKTYDNKYKAPNRGQVCKSYAICVIFESTIDLEYYNVLMQYYFKKVLIYIRLCFI